MNILKTVKNYLIKLGLDKIVGGGTPHTVVDVDAWNKIDREIYDETGWNNNCTGITHVPKAPTFNPVGWRDADVDNFVKSNAKFPFRNHMDLGQGVSTRHMFVGRIKKEQTTEEQIIEIWKKRTPLSDEAELRRQIGTKFGISRSTLSKIITKHFAKNNKGSDKSAEIAKALSMFASMESLAEDNVSKTLKKIYECTGLSSSCVRRNINEAIGHRQDVVLSAVRYFNYLDLIDVNGSHKLQTKPAMGVAKIGNTQVIRFNHDVAFAKKLLGKWKTFVEEHAAEPENIEENANMAASYSFRHKVSIEQALSFFGLIKSENVTARARDIILEKVRRIINGDIVALRKSKGDVRTMMIADIAIKHDISAALIRSAMGYADGKRAIIK